MNAYPVFDIRGKTVGMLTMYDDEIPKLMMEGQNFILGGAWEMGLFNPKKPGEGKEFKNYFIVPDRKIEKKNESNDQKRQ